MRPVRGQRADRPGPGPFGKASPLAPVVRLGVVGDRMVEYGGEVPDIVPGQPVGARRGRDEPGRPPGCARGPLRPGGPLVLDPVSVLIPGPRALSRVRDDLRGPCRGRRLPRLGFRSREEGQEHVQGRERREVRTRA